MSVGQRGRCPPLNTRKPRDINDGVAHQTSLRSQRDHDDSCGLPLEGGGSPTHFAGPSSWTTSPHRHPRIQASPRRRGRWSATAKLLVIDLIAQENPESDPELPGDGDSRFAEPLLLELSPIETPQRGVAAHGMDRG